jgi:putative DNA primase/helicase
MRARGFRIFPIRWLKAGGICSCPEGAACNTPGKHPRIKFWQKLACADVRVIRAWWRQWPLANIGILTGAASGIYVVDVDLKRGGDVSLMELCERHGIEWPDTLTVLTGSGGFHYYFLFPEGLDLRNTSGKLGRGIDTRGNGGYVVAPPSLHASGNRYVWVNDLETAPLPEALIKLLTVAAPSESKTRTQATGGARMGLVIPEGGRNQALFIIGCSMRGKGKSLAEIEVELLDNNARRCSPPLPEEEVLKIARSASSYAANRVGVGV